MTNEYTNMQSKLNFNSQCKLDLLSSLTTRILRFSLAVFQFNIAVVFEQGFGINKNLVSASRWFHRAASNGHIQAQNSLGILYLEGRGVRQDYELALAWFTKAALQGNNYAQHSLVKMYGRGIGVKQDYDLAFFWYLKVVGITEY